MLNKRVLVLSITVAAIALAILLARIVWQRNARQPASQPIPDLAVTSPLNQPGGGQAPADAYEVYSALYREPMQEPLVFSDDSVTDIPQVNGSCLQPSTPLERELADAFVAANRQSHRWEPKFTIPAGYRLISRSQATVAQRCIETHFQDRTRCDAFRPVAHVRFLGVPAFDRTHRRALVSIVKMCGIYCGSGGISEVEKTGSTWRRAEPTDFTRDCSWMY